MLIFFFQEQRRNGVIAASAGNHALALSYHGRDLGIPIFVVMPLIAPIMKVSMCKQYGANVIIHGEDIGVVSIPCNYSLAWVGGSLDVFQNVHLNKT